MLFKNENILNINNNCLQNICPAGEKFVCVPIGKIKHFFKEMSLDKMPVGTMSVGEKPDLCEEMHLCSSFFFTIVVPNFTNIYILLRELAEKPTKTVVINLAF